MINWESHKYIHRRVNTNNTIPYIIILLRKSATKKPQRFPPHPFTEHSALLTPPHPSQPTKPQLAKPRFLPSGHSLPLTTATRVKPGRKPESSQAWISRNAPQFSCGCKGSCGTSEHSSWGKKPHQVCCRLPGVIEALGDSGQWRNLLKQTYRCLWNKHSEHTHK